jgi:hypothetical protein
VSSRSASRADRAADLERQQFGWDEFGAMVARMAGIEQNLGI